MKLQDLYLIESRHVGAMRYKIVKGGVRAVLSEMMHYSLWGLLLNFK